VRRERPAPPPNGGIPQWVRRFNPVDWPVTDDGDDEARRPVLASQRARWQRERRGWCRAHGIDLRALIGEGRAESVYAQLRPVGRRPAE